MLRPFSPPWPHPLPPCPPSWLLWATSGIDATSRGAGPISGLQPSCALCECPAVTLQDPGQVRSPPTCSSILQSSSWWLNNRVIRYTPDLIYIIRVWSDTLSLYKMPKQSLAWNSEKILFSEEPSQMHYIRFFFWGGELSFPLFLDFV